MAKNKKMNPILWFIFAIIIPVTVVAVLVLIIMNIAGFDTFNWLKEKGNNVPVISNMITTEEEADIEAKERIFQESMKEKDQELEELKDRLGEQETIIQDLEREILRLENNEDPTLKESAEAEQVEDNLKKIAKSYQEMEPQRAAIILQNISDRSTSVSILEVMSNDVRGEILQEMDPEIAADVTQRLMRN